MASDLLSASEDLDEVLHRHRTFVAKQEGAVVGRRSTAAGLSAMSRSQAVSHRPSAWAPVERPSSPQSPLSPGSLPRCRSVHSADGVADGDGKDGLDEEVDFDTRKFSKAQKVAMQRFSEIDAGKVPKNDVFGAIGCFHRRVETKVEFYRQRQDLVLPAIEERFMISDRSGVATVDICKLSATRKSFFASRAAAAKRTGPVVSNPGQQQQVGEAFPAASDQSDKAATSPTVLHTDASQGTLTSYSPSLVKDASKATFSSAGQWSLNDASVLSAVSSPRRAALLAERGSANEQHREAVRRLTHERQLSQRYALRDDFERKINRREVSRKQELLLKFLVTGMACQAAKSVVDSFHRSYASVSNAVLKRVSIAMAETTTGLDRLGDLCNDMWADHLEQAVALPGKLWKGDKKSLMVKSLQAKFGREVAKLRGDTICRLWDKALRCMTFIAKLRRAAQRSRRMELCKLFIHKAWRGYRIRSSVSTFFQQIRFLQRGLRASLRYSEAICQYIYLPTVWQLETEALFQIMGMVTKETIDSEVMKHRIAWDYSTCVKEVKRLGKLRTAFSVGAQLKARTHFQPLASYDVAHHSGLPLVDDFGHCLSQRDWEQQHGGANGSRRGRPSGFFSTLDRCRLTREQRQTLVRDMFRDGQAKWHHEFKKHKSRVKEFHEEASQWRLEALAMGPLFRNDWPAEPVPAPAMLQYMLLVDTERVKQTITATLLKEHSGK